MGGELKGVERKWEKEAGVEGGVEGGGQVGEGEARQQGATQPIKVLHSKLHLDLSIMRRPLAASNSCLS